MRNAILVVLVIGTMIFQCSGQQASDGSRKLDVAKLLLALRTDDENAKRDAYDQLSASQEAMRDPTVKKALLDLLDRENRNNGRYPSAVQSSATASTSVPQHTEDNVTEESSDSSNDEGHAEYLSALLGSVDLVADWKDARQVCILAHTPYNSDSAFASKLALAGELIVPCLTEMATSDLSENRAQAAPVLVQSRATVANLTPGTVRKIAEITVRALHDSDEIVRIETVLTLKGFGTRDMIPPLKVIAESDPSDPTHIYIRKWADEAIAAIEKRAGQISPAR